MPRARRRSPSSHARKARSRRRSYDSKYRCEYLKGKYTRNQLLKIASALKLLSYISPDASKASICHTIAQKRPDLMRSSWKNWIFGLGTTGFVGLGLAHSLAESGYVESGKNVGVLSAAVMGTLGLRSKFQRDAARREMKLAALENEY